MGHIVGEVVWYVYDMARLHQMCDWRQVLLWGAVRGNITHSGQIHVVKGLDSCCWLVDVTSVARLCVFCSGGGP